MKCPAKRITSSLSSMGKSPRHFTALSTWLMALIKSPKRTYAKEMSISPRGSLDIFFCKSRKVSIDSW